MWLWVIQLCRWIEVVCLILGLRAQTKPDAQDEAHYFARKSSKPENTTSCRTRRKPQWVIDEIIRIKAINPILGGRKIADLFNRRHEVKRQMTVSKSYVYEKIKQHRYQIQVLRRHLKHKRPKKLPRNVCWGVT